MVAMVAACLAVNASSRLRRKQKNFAAACRLAKPYHSIQAQLRVPIVLGERVASQQDKERIHTTQLGQTMVG
jgi:hypothetical protein